MAQEQAEQQQSARAGDGAGGPQGGRSGAGGRGDDASVGRSLLALAPEQARAGRGRWGGEGPLVDGRQALGDAARRALVGRALARRQQLQMEGGGGQLQRGLAMDPSGQPPYPLAGQSSSGSLGSWAHLGIEKKPKEDMGGEMDFSAASLLSSTSEAIEIARLHPQLCQVLTTTLAAQSDLHQLWARINSPQCQSQLEAAQIVHDFLEPKNVALSPVLAAILAEKLVRPIEQVVELQQAIQMVQGGEAAQSYSPEKLVELKENSRAEFFSQGRNLLALAEAQHGANEAHGSPCLKIAVQVDPPVVVRGYKAREPHFEPAFCVKVLPERTAVVGPVEVYFLDENLSIVCRPGEKEKELDDGNTTTFGGLRVDDRKVARMARTYLLFAAFVTSGAEPHWVGAVSSPFITITNSSQLPNAKAKLMWHSYGQPERQGNVSWTMLQDSLSAYFQKVTTPAGKDPRPFAAADFSYIHERVKRQDRVNWSSFQDLFVWLSTTADTCRERLGHRWVSTISAPGSDEKYWLCHGFLSGEDSARLLSGQPGGTFVVRFSQSKPHNLVISYVTHSTDGHVEHKLVDLRSFEGGRNFDDVLADFPFLLGVYIPNGDPIPKATAFCNPTNNPSKHATGHYV